MPVKMWFIRWFWLFSKKSNIFIWREICKRTCCPSIVTLTLLLFLAGFLTVQFLQKYSLWNLCFHKGTSMVHLFITFMEERGCVEMILMMQNKLVPTFNFLHAINADNHHHNKSFINYVFCRNWTVRNSSGTRLDSLAL